MAVAAASNPTPAGTTNTAKPALIQVAALLLTLAAVETGARALAPPPADLSQVAPAEGFRELPTNAPDTPVSQSPGSELILIGNSHTYAVPHEEPGFPMACPGRDIMPDELGKLLKHSTASELQVYLLSSPNLLPYEMLTRCLHLKQLGYDPRVVVLGLTWRNVARDANLRPSIFNLYRNPTFAPFIQEQLQAVDLADRAAILPHVDDEQRRAEHDAIAERMKSHADAIDERLSAWTNPRCALLGENADLRARLYRLVTQYAQLLWDRNRTTYAYDLVPVDFELNAHCVRALIEWYREQGVEVVVYLAPERDDLPPMMDPQLQADYFRELTSWCEEQEAIVVDARRVVPNEFWGYFHDSPDRSHFTQPGHRMLAKFLFDEIERRRPSVWSGGPR